MEITVRTVEYKKVKYLHADCGVRYWEDTYVDGVSDKNGTLIPCRDGDYWTPQIELETGQIINWIEGIIANIHYKVCDDGIYVLLNEFHQPVKEINGYVPKIMCPKENGYGDYIIMDVDKNGYIIGWEPILDEFSYPEKED